MKEKRGILILTDYQEDIGSEDEENNYYSLGGGNHLDLEENQGE